MLFTNDVLFVSQDTCNLGDSLNKTVRQDTKLTMCMMWQGGQKRKHKAHRVQAPSYSLAEIELYWPLKLSPEINLRRRLRDKMLL